MTVEQFQEETAYLWKTTLKYAYGPYEMQYRHDDTNSGKLAWALLHDDEVLFCHKDIGVVLGFFKAHQKSPEGTSESYYYRTSPESWGSGS